MQTNTLEIPFQTCSPLDAPPDSNLHAVLIDQSFHEGLREIALVEAERHIRGSDDLETGKAASRALRQIGCASCALAEVCVINESLEQSVEEGKKHEAFMKTAVMLLSAPKWLTAARINHSGVDGEQTLKMLLGSTAEQKAAIESLALEKLVANTTNRAVKEVTQKDIPILANKKLDPKEPLEVHEVQTSGHTYHVTDASKAVGFKGEPLDAASYGVLTGKLLSRMENNDAQGRPHIFTADNKMQKVIRKEGNSTLFELRMNGKNRMYFWITPAEDDRPIEVVIVGSHGGNDQTQRSFIDGYTK